MSSSSGSSGSDDTDDSLTSYDVGTTSYGEEVEDEVIRRLGGVQVVGVGVSILSFHTYSNTYMVHISFLSSFRFGWKCSLCMWCYFCVQRWYHSELFLYLV